MRDEMLEAEERVPRRTDMYAAGPSDESDAADRSQGKPQLKKFRELEMAVTMPMQTP